MPTIRDIALYIRSESEGKEHLRMSVVAELVAAHSLVIF